MDFDAKVLDAKQQRSPEARPDVLDSGICRARSPLVKLELNPAEHAPVMLKVGATNRPLAVRFLEMMPSLLRLIDDEPRQIAETESKAGGGVKIAARLGFHDELGNATANDAELAQVEERPEAKHAGAR